LVGLATALKATGRRALAAGLAKATKANEVVGGLETALRATEAREAAAGWAVAWRGMAEVLEAALAAMGTGETRGENIIGDCRGRQPCQPGSPST